MLLILDTNVLFSFFRRSNVYKLVRGLKEAGITLVSPDVMLSELLELKEEILKYSGISEFEFEVILATLTNTIRFVPKEEYEEFLEEAKKISPHIKDTALFALSLAFNKSPIWSREARLKRQKTIKVLSDEEIGEFSKS